MKALVFVSLLLQFLLFNKVHTQPINTSPQQLFSEAQIYYEQGKLSAALAFLDKVVAKEKNFIDAYLLRAKIKEALLDIKGAQTDYSIVLYLDPYVTEARFERARLYYQDDRFLDALTDFHTLLQLPLGETTTVYFKGNTDATGFSVNDVTTLQSDIKADIYNYISLTHFSLSHLDSAAYYIEQAIKRKPNEANFYVNYGLIFEEKKDTLSAIQAYQKALSNQADHSAALSNLAKLTQQSEFHQLVNESYDIAVEETGTYQTYYNRGIMRQSIGDHQYAIDDFNKALELGGNHDELYLMRGYSKEQTGDLEGAIDDYNWALKLNPYLTKAYTNRGNVHYKLKRYPLAIKDFDSAIELQPENAKLYYNRGLALYLNGSKKRACEDLQRALEMDFTSAQAPIEAYCEKPLN